MANSLVRYLGSYTRFVKNSISVESEYRLSFLFKNIAGLCWIVASFFAINVVFSQSSHVGGWDESGIVLLYISFLVSVDLFNLFLRSNFIRFSNLIRTGELDRILTRPINTRFMVSLMSDGLDTSVIFRILVGIILLFTNLPEGTNVLSIISYFLLLLLGNLAVYSAIFILHTLNIWLVKVDNMTVFSQSAFEIGRLPLSSWPKAMQFFLVSVFPIGIACSLAVQSLLGEARIVQFIIAVVVSVGLFVISQKFWNFALRHYSSASS